MNANTTFPAISAALDRLQRRVRWKRWLHKQRRLTCLAALSFLLLFGADALFGMPTLSLRITSALLVLGVGLLALTDWLMVWRKRLDPVGLAQLLERRYPELAERLVTVVQIDATDSRNGLAILLEADTARRLADVEPEQACPLNGERKILADTFAFLATTFIALAFFAPFATFADRFVHAWTTPLIPFEIVVTPGHGYALRGQTMTIEATLRRLDPYAAEPTDCKLVVEDDVGAAKMLPMNPSAEKFVAVLEDVRQSLRYRVEAAGVSSEPFAIHLVDPPVFSETPTLSVTPPGYMKGKPTVHALEEASTAAIDVLTFSTMRLALPLDRPPVKASLRVTMLPASEQDSSHEFSIPVVAGSVALLAKRGGTFQAALHLELEHGLKATLPVGRWTIHDDRPPRFTRPLRLHGGADVLQSGREYRIAPNDGLRLQTALEDDEGLGPLTLEYRINDNPARTDIWLDGKNARQMTIDTWLPLPNTLKVDDRLQFRVHAADNRRLRKGELLQSTQEMVPATELVPQVASAPSPEGGDGWITLRVERSPDGFVKREALAQADDVRDLVAKLKKKLQGESDQLQQLQRTIHQQTALQPAQTKQAEKLQTLNREIMADLHRAGQRFLTNPALADLAAHFFDIAETELQKSGTALERFRAKGRPLPDAEKELPRALEELTKARKKLDLMLDWNKRIAQDRLDQWQIEKLEKRQKDLAERLRKLQEEQPLSDAQLAKEIEAIRQEQARLAEQAGELPKENGLVQESLAALEQMRVQKIAEAAQQAAAEQKKLRELDPEKMPADIKARLDKLAKLQADLAGRVEPFARQNQGPNLKPAAEAAVALRKPKLDVAIERQNETEQRLHDWLGKLLPGGVVNKLREELAQLAKTQQAIRADLEKLGQDLVKLNDKMIAERLRDLLNRQKALHAAVARLPMSATAPAVRDLHKSAVQMAGQARDQLAAKDALASFESMEKTQQRLQALAGALPQALPVDRKDIKDAGQRARIEQVERYQKEQEQVRAATERLYADWMKTGGQGNGALAEKMNKLADDLKELVQKGGPDTKGMAAESAKAVEEAKKAMEASAAMKAKGEPTEAKKMDAEAAQKLELAVKQLQKLVQDQAMKNPPKTDAEKTAEALQESRAKMRQAEANLPKLPKDAQAAMQAAAQKLAEALNQANKQAVRNLPNPPARNPAAKASLAPGGRSQPLALKDLPLDAGVGKAWGELPGELKTRMMQDFRARFGEDYADMIRQYFDRLAETPTPARKE